MILLITNKNDITTDFIANELNLRKIKYYRFNTEEIGGKVDVLLDFSNEKYFLVDNEKRINIDLSKIKSVYYRRPELPKGHNLDLSDGERQFLNKEMFYVLEGIYKILKNTFWISPVFAIREAENKIYQVILARQLGFEVPESIISNIPNKVEDFICNYDNECIIKPIRGGLIQDENEPKIIFTSRISNEQVKDLHRINKCPTYFQKNIMKKSDIRVTVVGTKIFAAEILSQICEETRTDWRKGEHVELKYLPINLPENIKKKCIELTKKLGLNYSAIDFVLDTKGRFIFLEINPNGQWGWIEKRLDFKICESLVDLLIQAEV